MELEKEKRRGRWRRREKSNSFLKNKINANKITLFTSIHEFPVCLHSTIEPTIFFQTQGNVCSVPLSGK